MPNFYLSYKHVKVARHAGRPCSRRGCPASDLRQARRDPAQGPPKSVMKFGPRDKGLTGLSRREHHRSFENEGVQTVDHLGRSAVGGHRRQRSRRGASRFRAGRVIWRRPISAGLMAMCRRARRFQRRLTARAGTAHKRTAPGRQNTVRRCCRRRKSMPVARKRVLPTWGAATARSFLFDLRHRPPGRRRPAGDRCPQTDVSCASCRPTALAVMAATVTAIMELGGGRPTDRWSPWPS